MSPTAREKKEEGKRLVRQLAILRMAPFSGVSVSPAFDPADVLVDREPGGHPGYGMGGLVAFTAIGGSAFELRGVVDVWLVDGFKELVIADLRIAPNAELADWLGAGRTAGISSTELRKIRTVKLLDDIKSAIAQQPALLAMVEQEGATVPAAWKERSSWVAEVVDNTDLKRGRRGFPESFYRMIAGQYLAILAQGDTKRIKERLALAETERRGRPVSASDIKAYLARCKELDLLVFKGRGQVGARPGPRWNQTERVES